jgi:acylphosphatase
MKKHFNIRISGKVQGVFFRASTKDKADELGVKGFVRNETDGSVYVEAEGEGETVSKFIEWCRHGPRLARVDHCEVWEDENRNFSAFEISRSGFW